MKSKKTHKSLPAHKVNPFASALMAPVTALSDSELKELKAHVMASPEYRLSEALFKNSNTDLLIKIAADYCLPVAVTLEDKIQKSTGYSARRIQSFRKRFENLAKEVSSLNSVELPGGLIFTELICEFGDLKEGPIDIEVSIALAHDLRRLPTLLREYSRALEDWPHHAYRKLLSPRNWRSFRLTQLCLYVKVVTGRISLR